MALNNQPDGPLEELSTYPSEERALLLDLARRGLSERVAGRFFEPAPEGVPARLQEVRACFVTLTRYGELRGCIGQVRPIIPLYQGVVRNACAAGFHDSRFEPVAAEEIPSLSIEISVLTIPTPLRGSTDEILARLRPGVDGVLIESSGAMVTFLPQVWERLDNKVQFMERLCQKAGWDRNCWRRPEAAISVYQVECFESPGR